MILWKGRTGKSLVVSQSKCSEEENEKNVDQSTCRFSSIHPHLLPVLLMFLKLPKLFNFHIFRLAAEQEMSAGIRGGRETEKVKVLRKDFKEVYRETQALICC